MKKIAFAAAAAMIVLSASAASAATITGTSIPLLAGPPGVDDAFQVFLNGTSQVVGFPITLAGEAACANPANPINGCSFSRDTFTPASPPAQPGVLISPQASLANQIAVFYLPDGTTIDAIFALGCDVSRDTTTGLCNGAPNFTIVTPDPANPFNLGVLASAGVSIGFTGTEIAGPTATAFDLTNYITVSGASESQHYTARLVLNGANVVTAVPEPVTLSLFGAGLAGAAAMRRRKKRA